MGNRIFTEVRQSTPKLKAAEMKWESVASAKEQSGPEPGDLSHYGFAYAIDLPVRSSITRGAVPLFWPPSCGSHPTNSPKETHQQLSPSKSQPTQGCELSREAPSKVQRFAQNTDAFDGMRWGVGATWISKLRPATLTYFSGTSLSALAIKEC
jgi:hypothetical protein